MSYANLQKRHNQAGLATVEFAFSVPVLLLLLLATAEFGCALYQYNTLVKAVEDGARYLASEATKGTTGLIDLTAAKQTATKNLVVYGNTGGTGNKVITSLTTNQITVTSPDAVHVKVSAALPYTPIFAGGVPDFHGGTLGSTFTFQATATMRVL